MTKYGIGQPAQRVEDKRFLTGRGRYVDDIALPRQCYAAILLSPHAHARIGRIDTAAARAVPGVIAVLTGTDAAADGLGGFPPLFMPEDMGGPKGYRTLRPILVADRVRCVGDRVAMVVADTADAARDAADLIEVAYEALPAIVNLDDAVADGAPLVWEDCPGNVSVGLMFGDPPAAAAAFGQAKHVVSLRLENNRISANAMEPRGAIGDYSPADDSYTLYTSSQNPHGARQMLAGAIFHEPETKFRIVSPDVGGGFGMKADSYPEDALVLWASRRCGRPVKWIATRTDSLMGDNHGRDQIVHAEMALDEGGKILAIRAKALHAVGAYIVSAAMAPIVFSLRFIPSVYDVRVVDLSTKAVFTNTSPLGPYRGAGRPEAVYVTERLLDQAAAVMGIDPVELRRRNLISPQALPYHTQTHYEYDSGEFETVLDKCLAMADGDGFAARRVASESRGKRRGRAVSCYIEQGGIFNDRMELRFDPGGSVTIVAGTHSHGQGHHTVFAQLVAEWLGVPFETIRFVQGDTDQVPFGRGTYAARSSLVGGSALRLAADSAIEKGKAMAAHLMEAAAADIDFADGTYRIVGTDRTMAFTDVVKAFFRPAGLPPQFGVGLEATGSWSADVPNFPNGCHICEVEVDPETGVVEIDRYTVVDDVGRALNPLICEGQIQGGLAQGIGQALLEDLVYDRKSGQLLSGTFADYAMPRADDLPDFVTAFHEVPCKTNPLGVKGVGESGTIGAPSTVINAVIDALRPLGVGHIDMPATPHRVWQAIRSAQAARA